MPAKKKTTKKSGNSKLASQGSKIMAEAKRIRKVNPGLKWTECVKRAAKNV